VTRAKATRKSSARSTRKAPQAKGPANPVGGPIEIW
jgi:hypothetical protein